jgi:hypothetical protein
MCAAIGESIALMAYCSVLIISKGVLSRYVLQEYKADEYYAKDRERQIGD